MKAYRIEKIMVILLLVMIFPVSNVMADNITEYSHLTKINVSCDEYKGFVKTSLPEEFLRKEKPATYMDTRFYLDLHPEEKWFESIPKWYVKRIEDYEISNIENMYDGSSSTYFLAENDSIEFTFTNPSPEKIDKISIDILDSQIDSIKIFSPDEGSVDFSLYKDGFQYDLNLEETLKTDQVVFELEFEDILKITNVEFFSYMEKEERGDLYFYVDNNCDNEFNFYFGNFGKDHSKKGVQEPPVSFKTNTKTVNNPSYEDDFDDDGVPNHKDNCPYVYNPDQKDTRRNGTGDACEDWSGDGVINAKDVCPEIYNPGQNERDCREEDRFFEKYPFVIYILAFITALVFVTLSIKVLKKE
ncbi:MAG: thrombospondin type 3 repeat-containing protein [Nanoarchaeota archaeon]